MVAIEALEKLMVELAANGYKSDLLIEPAKKRLTLRCSMKEEDVATLARKAPKVEKTDRPGFRARQF